MHLIDYFPRRYLLGILIFFASAIIFAQRLCLSVAIKSITLELSLSPAMQGALLSSFYYGYLSCFFSGFLVKKLPMRAILLVCVLGASPFVCLFPLFVRSSVIGGALCIVCVGLFHGLYYPVVTQFMSHWFPAPELPLMVSFNQMGMPVGTMIVMGLGPVIIENVDWPSLFYIFSACGFLWAIYWCLCVGESPESFATDSCVVLSSISEQELTYIKNTVQPHATAKRTPWLRMLKDKGILALWYNQFASFLALFLFMGWLPTYIDKELGFDLKQSGIVGFLPYLLLTVTQFIAGYLLRRLTQEEKITKLTGRKIFQCTSTFVPALFLIILAFANPNVGGTVALLILSVGCLGFHAAGMAGNAMDLSHQHSSMIFGIGLTFGTLGGIAGIFGCGLVLENSSSTQKGWDIIFLTLAALLITAAIVYYVWGSVTNNLDLSPEEEKALEDEEREAMLKSQWRIHLPGADHLAFYFPRRYILLLMLFFGSLITYTQRMSVPLSLNAMVRDGLLEQDDKGGLLASFYYGYLFCFASGFLTRRIQLRYLLFFSLYFASLSILVFMAFFQVTPLAGALCIVFEGLSNGIYYPTAVQFIGRWFPEDEYQVAILFLQIGMSLGVLLAYGIGPLVVTNIGWLWLFVFTGVTGAVFSFLWVRMPESPEANNGLFFQLSSEEIEYINAKKKLKTYSSNPIASSEIVQTLSGKFTQISSRVPWRAIVTSPAVWALWFNQFVSFMALFFFLSWLPTYLSVDVFSNATQGTATPGFIVVKDADITLVLPILCLFAFELIAAYVTIRVQKNERKMLLGKFDMLETKPTCRQWIFFSKQMWRKIFQFMGTAFPAIALIILSVGSSIEHASTNTAMKVTQVTLLMIALGFMGLQTGGQSINALDLSPEHASVIYGIGLGFGTVGAIFGTHGMGWLLQVTIREALASGTPFPDSDDSMISGWYLLYPNIHQAWHIAFLALAIALFLAAIVFDIFGSTKPIIVSRDEEERLAAEKRKKDEARQQEPSSRRSNEHTPLLSVSSSSTNNNSGQFSSSATFASLHNSISDSVSWFRRFGNNPGGVSDGSNKGKEESETELLDATKRNFGRVSLESSDESNKDGSKHESGSFDDSSVDSELKPAREIGYRSYGTY